MAIIEAGAIAILQAWQFSRHGNPQAWRFRCSEFRPEHSSLFRRRVAFHLGPPAAAQHEPCCAQCPSTPGGGGWREQQLQRGQRRPGRAVPRL